jgi:hypothetical protein
MRTQLNEAVQRAEQAGARTAEAERAMRVHSVERYQATDGHTDFGKSFPTVRPPCSTFGYPAAPPRLLAHF